MKLAKESFIIITLTVIESLQVGFIQSMVEVHEALEMVTLTVELDQNSWLTRPVTFTYSTSETVGAPNAASKLLHYLIRHYRLYEINIILLLEGLVTLDYLMLLVYSLVM